ncbi:MAG: 7-cyano-7-deazaguanine synthase QueC, partial [Cyanobacteria bacterium P01_A01_bin.83]
SFRYGQRHQRELDAAQKIVAALDIKEHFITDIDLSQWGGSSLTDQEMAIPQDGVQPDMIPSTYVPGRNTVFMAIALSLAEAKQAQAIYLGINAVDYSGYPDCRPEYLAAFEQLANLSSKAGVEGNAPQLIAPLVKDTKADIVRRALELNVPIADTWSCYQGGETPCGVCDSCRIRDRALIEVGRTDLVSDYARNKLSVGDSWQK